MTAELPFQELASILRRRIWLILAVATAGTVLICAVVLMIRPQYTAKAEIVVEPQPAGIVGGQAAVVALPPDEPAVLTEEAALTSHDHLRRVLDSLSNDPAFRAALAKVPSGSETIDNEARRWLIDRIPWSWLPAVGHDGGLTLRQLERHLKVAQEKGSHAISISFTSVNPAEAAMVANRVTTLYLESEVEQKRKFADSALIWLGKRIPELKDEVEQREQAEQAYQSAHRLSATDRTAVVDQQVIDLNRQLAAAEVDLAVRQARLGIVRNLQAHGFGVDALPDYLGSPALVELHRQELALLQSQAALAGTLGGAQNPKLQQVRNQLAELRRQTSQEFDRTTANLQGDAQIAAAQVHSIQERLTTVQGPTTDLHLRELEREAAASRRLYESMLQRKEELQEQREMLSPGVRILSLASLPDRPNSFNPILFVFPALIAFVVCGGLLAVLMDRLDQTLKSERDVSEALGILCIGMVPQLSRLGRRRPHELVLDSPFAPYSEAVRSVAAGLHLATPDRAPKIILISSSLPGEGKTTLAVSFAAYAARLKRRVLLVDFDFRHPSTARELGGEAGKRPVDPPSHDLPVDATIMRIPGLELDYMQIRCGSADPLTLFASERMSELLHRLRMTYDCVVIDSAPLLAITESRLLAALVDKVVFVVKWASTRRSVAQNALGLLRNTGILDKDRPDFASAVIMQVDLKKHARYRYGDTGEFVMRYGGYHAEAPVRAAALGSDRRGE